jgi:hypothetical protein
LGFSGRAGGFRVKNRLPGVRLKSAAGEKKQNVVGWGGRSFFGAGKILEKFCFQ